MMLHKNALVWLAVKFKRISEALFRAGWVEPELRPCPYGFCEAPEPHRHSLYGVGFRDLEVPTCDREVKLQANGYTERFLPPVRT